MSEQQPTGINNLIHSPEVNSLNCIIINNIILPMNVDHLFSIIWFVCFNEITSILKYLSKIKPYFRLTKFK